MPSKIQLDENLWFLFICLQKSDLKTIDFAAVGAATNLKPPAARMRYTRLKRQIESGGLMGRDGGTFPSTSNTTAMATSTPAHANAPASGGGMISGSAASSPPALKNLSKKRKVSPAAQVEPKVERGGAGGIMGAVGTTGTISAIGSPEVSGVKVEAPGQRYVSARGVVKQERPGERRWESSESEDSEDEMPLAKLRKGMGGERIEALRRMETTRTMGGEQENRPSVALGFNPVFEGSESLGWGAAWGGNGGQWSGMEMQQNRRGRYSGGGENGNGNGLAS